mgnify:CR=1 FL=1
MLKTTITGIPIHVTADRIVVQNGAAVDTYSRDWYRMAHELEQPFELVYGLHAIAKPRE